MRRRWFLLGLVVVLWAGFVFFDRDGMRTVELGQPERLTIVSDAGPVHVVERLDGARAIVTESWFGSRPTLERADDGGATVLRIRCGGVSCRATTRVEVGPGIDLSVVADGHTVQIDQFSGSLTAIARGAEVDLGAVAGSVRIQSDGPVRAARLDADIVDVGAANASVDLRFITPPAEVTIRAGDEPITLAVPIGPGYAADIGAGEITIADEVTVVDLDEDAPADGPGRLVVRSTGMVTIDAIDPDEA